MLEKRIVYKVPSEVKKQSIETLKVRKTTLEYLRQNGFKTVEDIIDKQLEINRGKNLDVIIGGPPCQAYSVIGRSRTGSNNNNDNGKSNDKSNNNSLFTHCFYKHLIAAQGTYSHNHTAQCRNVTKLSCDHNTNNSDQCSCQGTHCTSSTSSGSGAVESLVAHPTNTGHTSFSTMPFICAR